MVRLITHNLLACHVKGCTSNNFPLTFKDVRVELRETESNPEFIRNIIPRLEWSALVGAAREVRDILPPTFCVYVFMRVIAQVGDTSLPLEQPEMMSDDLLAAVHHVLLEVRDPSLPMLP